MMTPQVLTLLQFTPEVFFVSETTGNLEGQCSLLLSVMVTCSQKIKHFVSDMENIFFSELNYFNILIVAHKETSRERETGYSFFLSCFLPLSYNLVCDEKCGGYCVYR